MEPKSSDVVKVDSLWYWKPDNHYIVIRVLGVYTNDNRVEMMLVRHDLHKNVVGENRTWKLDHFLRDFRPMESDNVRTILERYEV